MEKFDIPTQRTDYAFSTVNKEITIFKKKQELNKLTKTLMPRYIFLLFFCCVFDSIRDINSALPPHPINK